MIWLKQNSKMVVLLTLFLVLIYAWFFQSSGPDSERETPADMMSNLPKMVELYTPTCPSCRAMEPLLEQLKEICQHRGVGVDMIDISKVENEHIADELDVIAVPTFIFLDQNGIETARLVGKQTELTLKAHLTDLGGQCLDHS